MDRRITVLEDGKPITYGFDDLTRYHGYGFPGGITHAFKVLERTLPLLDGGAPVERREIAIDTSFGGPGGRDTFEMVTRAVTRGAYTVDPALGQPWADQPPRHFYYFRLAYRGNAVAVVIRPGHVRDAFIALARKPDRTPAEEASLAELKQEMADRLMPQDPADIYELAS